MLLDCDRNVQFTILKYQIIRLFEYLVRLLFGGVGNKPIAFWNAFAVNNNLDGLYDAEL